MPSPPLGLDEEVQSGYDQAVVHPAVRTTHSFGQSHVPPVLGPSDNIVNEVPMPRMGCIHDVLLRVGRRTMVLVMARWYVTHVLSMRSRRNPLLLHSPTPCFPMT